jgi:hypothetical protein
MVSAVEEPDICPKLDEALIAPLAAVNKELRQLGKEKYVPPSKQPAPRIIIELTHNDVILCGLIDTGSELNLISGDAAAKASLILLPLPRPTVVNLAMDNQPQSNLILQHYVKATLQDPGSGRSFNDVLLKVGPIIGDHDLIL